MQNWRNKITFTGSSDENLSGVSHQFCIGKRKHANTGKMLAVILTVMISLLMCHNMGKKLINKKKVQIHGDCHESTKLHYRLVSGLLHVSSEHI